MTMLENKLQRVREINFSHSDNSVIILH